MGVGPPGRTGRDQIAQVHAFLAEPRRRAGQIVAICCEHGAGAYRSAIADHGAALYTVDCAGNLHTTVIELLLRAGAGGVLVLACQPRDCRSREGPRWLVERLYHGREAELQARVDRRRVQVVHVAAGERQLAISAQRAFANGIPTLPRVATEPSGDLHSACEPVTTGGQS
jgi:coenzyme F420-reducing hydrogenase delta subunit